MKQVLDGTFTTIIEGGKTRTVLVPFDYIPQHVQLSFCQKETLTYAGWDEGEDNKMLEMLEMGFPMSKVADHLNRTDNSCHKRLRILRANGRAARRVKTAAMT